jgi:site-specific DNA recombinase
MNNSSENKSIAYIRLSKDDGSNPSLSPEHQKAICENHAKKKGDYISKVYQDINRTGSNALREGLEQLMEDAKKRLFSKLYIKDWSRLARNIIIQETIINELSDLGIEIISCDGIEDKKARQVTGLTNEWFIDECRKKQQQVHKLKLAEQIPCSRPPYGYRMSKKLKRFIIKEEEAEDVRKIFKLRKEGLSISNIAKEMKMYPSKVFGILKNRTYLGEIKYAGEWMKGRHEKITNLEI